jgi:hypothetical protein
MVAPTTPAEHQRQVGATFVHAEPRTAEIMQSAVRHLCAFVEEVG